MIPIKTTHVDDGVKMAYEMLVYVGYDFSKQEKTGEEDDNCND